jgi:pilus assembly protein CpaB
MRSTRALIMMVAAVIAGLIAVVLASQWISRQSQFGASKVVVLGADIQLGSRLTPEMLKLVDWPTGSVPTGAFTDPKNLDGRVVKTSLQRGEPVLESKLAPVGTKGGLSSVVTEGKRAITVRVNDVIGVAGFALPGNYVDIMVSTQQDTPKSDGRDNTIAKIVLERILVLAVAQESSRDETKPKVVNAVTLEVTPEEAEKLDVARSVGTLSLVLRNQIDPKEAQTQGATKSTLMTGSKPTAAAPPAKSAPVAYRPRPKPQTVASAPAKQEKSKVEMIKGISKSTVEF